MFPPWDFLEAHESVSNFELNFILSYATECAPGKGEEKQIRADLVPI